MLRPFFHPNVRLPPCLSFAPPFLPPGFTGHRGSWIFRLFGGLSGACLTFQPESVCFFSTLASAQTRPPDRPCPPCSQGTRDGPAGGGGGLEIACCHKMSQRGCEVPSPQSHPAFTCSFIVLQSLDGYRALSWCRALQAESRGLHSAGEEPTLGPATRHRSRTQDAGGPRGGQRARGAQGLPGGPGRSSASEEGSPALSLEDE